MIQAKFSLDEPQVELLERCKQLGFKDKSAMVRAALVRLREQLDLDALRESAELYAEVYDGDKELQELTDAAVAEWPGDAD